MKFSREQYQHGSVCEVPRSQGFTREFRFYTTAPDGKRKLWVQTLVCGCLGLRVSEAQASSGRTPTNWCPGYRELDHHH
jgi:hypothetical protein